jgi:hypothetical protein
MKKVTITVRAASFVEELAKWFNATRTCVCAPDQKLRDFAKRVIARY